MLVYRRVWFTNLDKLHFGVLLTSSVKFISPDKNDLENLPTLLLKPRTSTTKGDLCTLRCNSARTCGILRKKIQPKIWEERMSLWQNSEAGFLLRHFKMLQIWRRISHTPWNKNIKNWIISPRIEVKILTTSLGCCQGSPHNSCGCVGLVLLSHGYGHLTSSFVKLHHVPGDLPLGDRIHAVPGSRGGDWGGHSSNSQWPSHLQTLKSNTPWNHLQLHPKTSTNDHLLLGFWGVFSGLNHQKAPPPFSHWHGTPRPVHLSQSLGSLHPIHPTSCLAPHCDEMRSGWEKRYPRN